jgi:hypothetical protein
VLLAGAAVAALLIWNLARFWPYPNDDAYITFRYSLALARGHGPYFNPGEHVEGYTNPLLMLLVALWIFLAGPGTAALFAKILGLAAAAASAALAGALCAQSFPQRRAALFGGLAAAGLVAVSPLFAVNSVSGLETSLYAALLAGGAVASARGRERTSAAAFALAILTRPDGAFVFGVHWLARLCAEGAQGRLRPRLRPLLESAAAVTILVGLQFLLRHSLYDGEWLPNTYYAKLGGFGRLDYWLEIYDGGLGGVFGAAGLLLAAAGFALDRRVAGRLSPAWFAGLAAAHLPALTGPDWMIGSRFVVPSLPLLAGACAGGWTALLIRPPLPSRAAAAVVLVIPLGLWLQEPVAADLDRRLAQLRPEVSHCHSEISRWLTEHARPGDGLAITDIGLIGFENPDLWVLDISGLTDRAIGKSPGRFLEKRYDPGLVLKRHPRWIVLNHSCDDSPLPQVTTEGRLEAAPDFGARYRLIRSFAPPAPFCTRRFALFERTGQP